MTYGADQQPGGLDAGTTPTGADLYVGEQGGVVVKFTHAQLLAFVTAQLGGADVMVYKGVVDCSANPNYPAADAGQVYVVSVAGKIGGASGTSVEAGDLAICKVDATASGNQATVGAAWDIVQTNIVGAVAAAAYNSASAAEVYGDSVSTGIGATTPSTDGYIPILATARGVTVTNHAVSGDQVADQLKLVNALAVADGSYSTFFAGLNDTRQNGSNSAKAAIFQSAHLAALAWLAMPAAFKKTLQGGSVSTTGTWLNDTANGNIGKSAAAGAAATATAVVYGTTVYIGYIVLTSSGGSPADFSVTVDGVAKGTYSCTPAGTFTTQNGQTYQGQLLRLTGLSEDKHTVVITVPNTNSGTVFIDWIGANLGATSKDGPNVFVGNLYRLNSTGYAVSPANSSDAIIAAANAAIRANVEALAGDGLNVALVDICARFDIASHLNADGVHPNNAGHIVIRDAFREAMNQIGRIGNRFRKSASAVASSPGVLALTDGATISSDASVYKAFRVTLGGNRTLANPTGSVDGDLLQYLITQDGTGARTLAYGSKFAWEGATVPALSTAASAEDLLTLTRDASADRFLARLGKNFLVPATSLSLDSYTGLWAVLDPLRRQLIAYTGPLLRIRRSSDSTELDIGYTGANVVDSAAAVAFAGAGQAYVVKIYDQTGNGNHLVQTGTTGKQPRVVNAGVWDGKVVFDATDDCMTSLNASGTPTAMSFLVKRTLRSPTATQIMVELGTDTGSTVGQNGVAYYAGSGGTYPSTILASNGTTYESNSFTNNTAASVAGVVCNRGNASIVLRNKFWEAGALKTSSSTGSSGSISGNFSALTWNIGARNNGASSPASLDFYCLVIAESDKTSEMTALSAAIA